MQYLNELQRKLQGISADVRNANRLIELEIAGDKVEPQHELDNDLPAYLVFMILANTRKLRDVSPDHILVKAVHAACLAAKVPPDPDQMDLKL